jgi:hypothetical protein
MARVLVAAQTLPGSYPTLPLTTAGLISEQAADSALYQYTPLITGKTIVHVHNTDTNPHTFTITSIADAQNRTGDIGPVTLAAGATQIVGPFATLGWNQAGNQLWFQANDATVKFAVITLP